MNIHTFKLLSQEEQADLLWEEGVHIATRFTTFFTIALYQLEGFYAEVFFNELDNEIDRIRSFYTTDLLTPYLKQICLKSLLEEY